MYISGIAGLELGVEQIGVYVDKTELAPCFVMDLNSDHDTVTQAGIKTTEKTITLVHFEVPDFLRGHTSDVQLRLKLEYSSSAVPLALPNPAQPSLQIQLILNAFDSGVDVYTSGPKSEIRVITEGLDKGVTIDELSIRIGDESCQPKEIEFAPSNGLHYVNVNLPEGLVPGQTEVAICYRSVWSPTVPLELH